MARMNTLELPRMRAVVLGIGKGPEREMAPGLAWWQGQKDLNPRHAVLETAALPTELYPYVKMVGHQGLEPGTDRL